MELHPSEPWVLANLYSGNVIIWNHATNQQVKSFEVTELPVRTARFVVRKQWVVAGSDDMFIRCYNYNTSELVKAFEAHTDYIRALAVHPTLPYVLSSSDDMLIKLWDWDKGWQCSQVFEGHSHYVMAVTFNPKDTNTFASASLDRTIKVWSLGQAVPNFTLEGHEKGVNCVDYFSGGDRPYLISGADDKLVKIWDYQTKSCVQTLEGHSHNVSAVVFHPELPLIITGSEDGTLRLWHSTTYRLENTLSYGLERAWSLAVMKGSNDVACGYDEGTVMFKIGREEPVASMDPSGKIIWAKHNEIQTVNVRSVPPDVEIADGERLPLTVKDLGSCDLYPQSLGHNPNGRFVAVCGDGEYIIYTALAWRNKCFGSALDVVWGADASEYAVRESASKVVFFKNFAEKKALRPAFAAEGLHGGALLGVRSSDFICFYDWAECRVVRRIDVAVKNVYWSDSGDLLCIAAEQAFYILRFDRAACAAALAASPAGAGEEVPGMDDAFELLHEVQESVRTGLWVGDCFIYNNADWRLNYCVGGEVTTLFHLDRPLYLLGYMASQNRLYLLDKEHSVVSYTLLLSLLEYKTLVLRGDMQAAAELLPSLPKEALNGVARFLEARGFKAEALAIATDADFKFELAVALGDMAQAVGIAETLGAESRWKQLGEMALAQGDLQLAQGCLWKACDLPGLLLLFSCTGDAQGMAQLAEAAVAKGKHNVALVALLLLQRVPDCVQLLSACGRVPEAAFAARTYAPSAVSAAVALWRADLAKVNKKAAEALADPAAYANLFKDFDAALQAEAQRGEGGPRHAASAYPQHAEDTRVDAVVQLKQALLEAAEEAQGDAEEAQEEAEEQAEAGEADAVEQAVEAADEAEREEEAQHEEAEPEAEPEVEPEVEKVVDFEDAQPEEAAAAESGEAAAAAEEEDWAE